MDGWNISFLLIIHRHDLKMIDALGPQPYHNGFIIRNSQPPMVAWNYFATPQQIPGSYVTYVTFLCHTKPW